MKLFKLTFLLSIIFFSCQSDDANDINPIIGKWKQISEIESGTDYTNECTSLNTIEIINDGTAIIVNYNHVIEGGEPYKCIFNKETELQWRTNGNIITTSIKYGESLEHESIFTIENDILTIENKPKNQPFITTYKKFK